MAQVSSSNNLRTPQGFPKQEPGWKGLSLLSWSSCTSSNKEALGRLPKGQLGHSAFSRDSKVGWEKLIGGRRAWGLSLSPALHSR